MAAPVTITRDDLAETDHSDPLSDSDPGMPFPEPPSDPGWVNADDQPVVRPYAMTFGRTRPTKGHFDLTALIMSNRPAAALSPGHSPEHVRIVHMCQRAISVAEVAAYLDLPISVVRVFLGDLLHLDLISVRQPQPAHVRLSDETLEALLDGLRAL